MFFIVAFIVVGITALAIDSLGTMLLLAIPLALLLIGVGWLSGQLHFGVVIVGSWQFLSGANDPTQVWSDCGDAGVMSAGAFLAYLVAWLFMMGLLLISFPIGLVAVIGLPVGVLLAIIGGIVFLLTRKTSLISWGIWLLVFALGATILVGLLLRVVHVVSAATC